MECSICMNTYSHECFKRLHDLHTVCTECHRKLRDIRVTSCPFCRAPINADLPQPRQQRAISDIQLRSFGISQPFIDTIRDRLPFIYSGRFESVDFIITISEEHRIWLQSTN